MLAGGHSTCEVVRWWFGIKSDCKLEIEYNQKCFHVTLSPTESLANTIEGLLLQRLDNAQRATAEDEDEDEVLEEIADIVCEAGILQFERLAPPNAQGRLPTDLYSFLHPETFYFQLVTVEGRAQMVQKDKQALQAQLFPLETAPSTLPTFEMRDIQVLQTLRGSRITKVVVGGRERCCKISSNVTQSAVQREFDCISQVMAADAGSSIRVPKLVGLVRAPNDNGQVVGIIEEFIHSRPGYPTLRSINGQNVTDSQRAKWAEQVRQTVEDLHRIEVIWGDGKADNVLLDADEDAWLIDFGGGWTQDWVDENLAGTLEGDTQAVEKIEEFLGVEKQ